MSQVNKLSKLPPLVRQMIDDALEKNGFSDYTGIADDFTKRGFKISRSSLHRYGRELKAMLRSAAMEAAVTKALSDDAAWLVHWARQNPIPASRLVAKLKKKALVGGL